MFSKILAEATKVAIVAAGVAVYKVTELGVGKMWQMCTSKSEEKKA